jgi:nitrite reductase/ring-hydroxylating ferredoxin subunit
MDRQENSEPLCALADIGDQGKEVRTQGLAGPEYLMLFRRNGQLSAWRNVCPHQGRALNWAPDQFLFSSDGLLVCAHHGASFELEGGQCVTGPCMGGGLTRVPVFVEDGRVYLGLSTTS